MSGECCVLSKAILTFLILCCRHAVPPRRHRLPQRLDWALIPPPLGWFCFPPAAAVPVD